MKTPKIKSSSNVRKAYRSATDFPDFASGEEFDALSDAEKERVAEFYSQGRHRDEARPLSPRERVELAKDRANGKSAKSSRASGSIKVISLSVHSDLLKRADAFAKAEGLKRDQLVEQALTQFLTIAT